MGASKPMKVGRHHAAVSACPAKHIPGKILQKEIPKKLRVTGSNSSRFAFSEVFTNTVPE